jgi:hypothetical protein
LSEDGRKESVLNGWKTWGKIGYGRYEIVAQFYGSCGGNGE